MSKVETFFLLSVNEDGSLTSYTTIPEDLPEANRTATTWDVYQTARQIVEEFDRKMLVDQVIQGVVGALMPPTQSVQDKVKDALKDRGIDPESVTPAE
jgi:hypothetical protein